MDKEERNFPSGSSDEQRTDKGSHGEQAAEDLKKSSLDKGAPAPAGRQQDNADHTEGRGEEDKGPLDKAKDKLKGE